MVFQNSKNDESDDMSDIEADPNNHNCSPSIPANPDCIAPMLGKNDASIFLAAFNCQIIVNLNYSLIVT